METVEMIPYYQDSVVTIYCGAAQDVLSDLDPFPAFVTDPPYGINGGVGGTPRMRGKGQYQATVWNDDAANIANIVVPVIRKLVGDGSRGALTPGNRCMYLYDPPADIGCFWSPADSGFGPWGATCFHPILYYGKDWRAGKGPLPTGRYIQGNSEKNGHPCPKPLKEWRWLVNKVVAPGEVVLDSFMGSGTTLRAAKDLGLKAIGIDIEERYCEIAARRMSQEVLSFG